jgi:hypothetical protein
MGSRLSLSMGVAIEMLPRSRLVATVAAFVVCGGGALVLAGVAAADKEKVRLTTAGQAAARTAVLTRADMGPLPDWTGGAQKPSPPGTPPCATYRPKQSDLLSIGSAETQWKRPGLDFQSDAQVLATPRMVLLDWQRTVVAPQMLPCMRSALAKKFSGGTTRFVSTSWTAFPRLAPYTRALRIVLSVKTAAATMPVMLDTVLVGKGRTEVTLTATAPLAAADSVQAAEIRLARLLVARIRG